MFVHSENARESQHFEIASGIPFFIAVCIGIFWKAVPTGANAMNSITAGRTFAFALLLLAYPLSFCVADWWSWENGPLEILDNLVLLVGALQALWLALRSRSPLKWLWIAVLPVWIVCLGREMAFGAVFLPPSGVAEDGPVFTSKVLWYHGLIAPSIAVLALISLTALVRFKLWRLLPAVVKAGQFPSLELVMTTVSFLLMTAAERHMHMSLDAYVGIAQIIEETVELAGYVFLLTAQQRIRIGLAA